MMITLSKEKLQNILNRFKGKLIDEGSLTGYQRKVMSFFCDPKKVPDPRVQFTSQFDITEIYQNYEANYKSTSGSTFTAFVKWVAIKSMQNTQFNWRFINNQWYEFQNLPLEVSVFTQDERQQLLNFIDDVDITDWEEFCKKHAFVAQGTSEDYLNKLDKPDELPLYALAHQIVGVHIPQMTSYNTTLKSETAHLPWLVFSDRYMREDKRYLPLHLSFSHAVLTPKTAAEYLNTFSTNAKLHSTELQKKYLSKMKESNANKTTQSLASSKFVLYPVQKVTSEPLVTAFEKSKRKSADVLMQQEAARIIGKDPLLTRQKKHFN